MPPAHLVGLGAGLVSGVLYTSAIPHTFLAVMLIYLTPTPLFLAALGWGPWAGLTAALSGSLLAIFGAGGQLGAVYVCFVALPSLALCRLIVLYRVRAPEPGAEGTGVVEWYPVGRLFAWAAVGGGALVAAAISLKWGGVEAYEGAFKPLFIQMFTRQVGPAESGGLSRDEVEEIAGLFARRFVPAFFAAFWVGAMMFNVWAASKVAATSGLLGRPEPDFEAMEFPKFLLPSAGAALLMCFAPGLPGVVADAFLGAFAFAFLILGLIVIRAITEGTGAAQPILMGLLYISVFMLHWPALFVIPFGVAEPFFKLRARAQAQARPPRG
jgi:hypothetical protein